WLLSAGSAPSRSTLFAAGRGRGGPGRGRAGGPGTLRGYYRVETNTSEKSPLRLHFLLIEEKGTGFENTNQNQFQFPEGTVGLQYVEFGGRC
ncbi:mCG1041367, partial [Mus musculus]